MIVYRKFHQPNLLHGTVLDQVKMWKDAWKDDHVNLYISSGSEAVILLTAKPNREYTYHDSLRMFLLYTVSSYAR